MDGPPGLNGSDVSKLCMYGKLFVLLGNNFNGNNFAQATSELVV